MTICCGRFIHRFTGDESMKLIWDDEETAGGFPVENTIVSKDDNGKIISAVAVVWFGQGNAIANLMNMDMIDGLQAVADKWSETKLGPPPTVGGSPKKP
jgi:hypothetical protein